MPPNPANRKRLCGEASFNIHFFLYNFLMTSRSYKNDSHTFTKVVYRQKIHLNKCADRHAKMSVTLTISRNSTSPLGNPPTDSLPEDNFSLHSLSDFSKISWNPQEFKPQIHKKYFNKSRKFKVIPEMKILEPKSSKQPI